MYSNAVISSLVKFEFEKDALLAAHTAWVLRMLWERSVPESHFSGTRE